VVRPRFWVFKGLDVAIALVVFGFIHVYCSVDAFTSALLTFAVLLLCWALELVYEGLGP